MCFYCYDCETVHNCNNSDIHGIGIGYCHRYCKGIDYGSRQKLW